MIRVMSILGMSGGFLVISPPLRGTALSLLGQMMFFMDKHSPYSYIVLAIALGVGAVWSLAAPKPQ